MIFIYVNVKFYRIGEYGTDIAAQLIVLILIPLILITVKQDSKKTFLKNNIQLLMIFKIMKSII